MRWWPASLIFLVSAPARAFVGTPVGGHPGELDASLSVTTERGKTEPNEHEASFMKPRDWYEYRLGVGYTWGHLGPLEFFSTRLEATHYRTPAERNDPVEWYVGPAGSSPPGAPAPECGAGARYLGAGRCEFYPEDAGTLVTATLSFSILHDPRFALGLFFKGTAPFEMNLEKFGNPRLDYLAGGTNLGAELRPWLFVESSLYLGSGTRPLGTQQNGAVALSTLFELRAERWLLPWRAGIKVGPYVEGDLNERHDERYDLAFSPVELPQPGGVPQRSRDRIRAARFALATLPYLLVTEHLAVEAGYVQKFFGYDARATQVYFVGLRGLVDVGG